MANVNSPLGLRPIGNGMGGTAPLLTKYTRSTTGAIGENAIVALGPTGPIVAVVTTHDDLSEGGQILGVVAHYVAAADTEMLVYDDPQQEFLVQGDSAVTTPLGVIGFYANVIDSITFSTTTLQSAAQLDSSELTSTAAAGDVLQVRRLWDGEDNDQDAADAKWVVKFRSSCHIMSSAGTRLT